MATKVKTATEKTVFESLGVDVPQRFRAGDNAFNIADAIAMFNDGKAEDSQNVSALRNRRMNQELSLILRGISQIVEFRNSTILAQVIGKAKLSAVGKYVIKTILPNAAYAPAEGKIAWHDQDSEFIAEHGITQETHSTIGTACVNKAAFAALNLAVKSGHDSNGKPTSRDYKCDVFQRHFKREKTDAEKAKAAQESLEKAITKGLIDRKTLQDMLANMGKS